MAADFAHLYGTGSMTPLSRREKIEAMLADEPRDTFLRYSLAMEFGKEGRHDESFGLFDGLMQDEPPYVPAFFMAAQQMARLDRIDDARTTLRTGIEQARHQNNPHAAGEMSELLASLGSLGQ
jgi:hypothetical protein